MLNQIWHLKARNRGFTLVEMMVAITIFSIVALAATSAFITADRVNKKAQAMKVVIDNLHFALSNMTFNLKQGGVYHCIPDASTMTDNPNPALYDYPSDCPAAGGPGGTGIVFLASKSSGTTERVMYRLNNQAIEFWRGSGAGTAFSRITIPNLVIEDLRFYVDNAEDTSYGMPRVFITVQGVASLGRESAPFQLETVVSERL